MRLLFLLTFGFTVWAAEPGHIYTLDGLWKAHTGDDLRWANPAFDDSSWAQHTIPLADPGFVWYRRTVEIPADVTAPVCLYLPQLIPEVEVYWNGSLVLQHGIPGRWTSQRWGPAPVIELKNLSPGTKAVLAIRIRDYANGGATKLGPPLLGSKSEIEAVSAQSRFWLFQWNISWLILGLLNLLFAVVSILFWRMQRDQPVYLWFAIAQVLEAFWSIPNFANVCSDLPGLLTLPADAASGVELSVWIMLFQSAPLWPGWRRVSLSVLLILPFLFCALATYSASLHWSYLYALNLAMISLTMVLVVRAVRTSSAEQRDTLKILLGPWLVYELGWMGWHGLSLYLSITDQFAGNNRTLLLLQEPFKVDLTQVGAILSVLAMGWVLLDRFGRVAREQQILSGELEAARQVQELLVPSSVVQVPGFELQSSYIPAQRVGGDFFQVLPVSNGGVLIVAGDVSGKGLRAAMVVSLVVGALRNRRSDEPGLILAELNNVLTDQMGGGFVTCCCARFDESGKGTIANAGHPSPYCGGHEVEVEAGLPLGIMARVAYTELVVGGDDFTFVSDGVVEAENAQRELFGFDRTRDISVKSAQEIAEAAKAWGQNDDITVVTVRRKNA